MRPLVAIRNRTSNDRVKRFLDAILPYLDSNNELKVSKAVNYTTEEFISDYDHFNKFYPHMISLDPYNHTIRVYDTIPVCPTGSRIPYFHLTGSEEFLEHYGKYRWFVDGGIEDPTIYTYTKTGRLMLLDEVASENYKLTILA